MSTLSIFTQFAQANARHQFQVKPNSYGNFKANQLDGNFRTQLNDLLVQVTGKTLSDDHSVLSFKSDISGFYDKAYVSSVVNSNGKLGLHFGNEIVTLIDELPSNIDISIEKVVHEKYEEPSLIIYDEDSDNSVSFPLRLSEASFQSMLETTPDGKKQLNSRKLTTAAKKGKFDVVAESLAEGKTGSSTELVDINNLPTNTLFPLKSIKNVNTSYGTSAILTVTHESQEYSFWIPSNLKVTAEMGYLVPNQVAIGYYLTEPNKAGKQYVKGYKADLQAQNTIEVKANVVQEPAKKVLPFNNVKEAVEWGMSQLPNYSEEAVQDLLKNAPKSDNGSTSVGFYETVTREAALFQASEVVTEATEAIAEASEVVTEDAPF